MFSTDSKIKDKKKLYYALFFPMLISFLMVLSFVFERAMGLNFAKFGIEPGSIDGIFHIFFVPFIHADIQHLLNNLIAFLTLSTCLYYFYNSIASLTLVLSVIFSGIILWIVGRESYHIGASGVVFALSFFLFFSGVIRKYVPLIAISLIVVFLYGNNVWHLVPWIKNDPVSWEGHLAGGITGALLAIFFRNKGPQKPEKEWDEDDNVGMDGEEEQNNE
ncbi:MAG: rhomboid family intramembrane serine protease [Paludibacteraceae bacterium]